MGESFQMNCMKGVTMALARKLSLVLLASLGVLPASSQSEFELWAQRVNWDGITPWKFYLTIAPGYMGPNALPVPRMQEGIIQERSYLELRPEYYGGRGDQTYDIAGQAYYPIVPGRIGLSAFMVGYEWYNMEPSIRDFRRARASDGKGASLGDFYFTTIFSLLKDHKKLPDLAIDVNLKTASGERLRDLRYNDAAGYSMNLSFGKSYGTDSSKLRMRVHGMIGFYIWQIFHISQQQNDAFTFGLGVRLQNKKWNIHQRISGYIGYRNERDQPLQYLVDLHRKSGMLDYGIGYTYGIRDFPYYSLRLSTIFYFPK